jgi:hypothetical protein
MVLNIAYRRVCHRLCSSSSSLSSHIRVDLHFSSGFGRQRTATNLQVRDGEPGLGAAHYADQHTFHLHSRSTLAVRWSSSLSKLVSFRAFLRAYPTLSPLRAPFMHLGWSEIDIWVFGVLCHTRYRSRPACCCQQFAPLFVGLLLYQNSK